MNRIFQNALSAYMRNGEDTMWTYLQSAVISGEIDDDMAERIATAVIEGE